MPRPKKSEEKENTETVKRVTRPRTPRAPAVDDVSIKRPARAKRSAEEETVLTPIRRAPTPIAALTREKKRSGKVLLGALILCLVMFGAGIVIGFSDKGAIDVVAMVNERNEKVTRGEVRDDVTGDTITETVPVQNFDQRPNGGLTPSTEADTPQVAPAPVIENASSTATTSEPVEAEEVTTGNLEEVNASTTPTEEEGSLPDLETGL